MRENPTAYIGTTWYGKLTLFYIVFAAIIQMYGYGGFLNFSRIISLALSLVVIFHIISNKSVINNLPVLLRRYFLWLFLIAVVSATSISDIIPLGQIESFLVFIAIFSFADYKKFLPLYKTVAYISVFFLIFQVLCHAITGVRISGVAEFLPLDLGVDIIASDYYEHIVRSNARFSSFFSEPALFVQYVIPLFIIEIYEARRLKDWILVALIAFSIISTRSGNGLVLMSVVVISFLSYFLKNKGELKYIILPFILLALLFCAKVYLNTENAQSLLERREEVSNGIDDTSGFIRIRRGYYVYEEYSVIEKIVGVNNISKLQERIRSCKASYTFGDNDYYANTFQKFLLNTGLVGVLFFLMIMFSIFKNNTPIGKTIICVYFVMSFISSTYLGAIMFLYLYMAYNAKNKVYKYYKL